jgi:2-(1,2-epoxy-1,2-dihydrophenyl)acetyl-CoA isomerase
MAEFKWNEAKLDSKWEEQDCFFELKGPVARFTLNRPEKRNSYTEEMWAGMRRACEEVNENPAVRVMVVTGAGDKAFCAGPAGFSKSPLPDEAERRKERGRILTTLEGRRNRIQGFWRHRPLYDCEVPIVCRMNGLAVGAGADWTMACDLIVAADHAFLGWWYAKRGLPTDMGGCWYLTQRVGPSKAKEIILTARNVPSQEMVDLGIAVKAVPYAQLDDATDELCSQLIANAPQALRADKLLIDRACGLERWTWFDSYAADLIRTVQASEDARERGLDMLRKGSVEWQNR